MKTLIAFTALFLLLPSLAYSKAKQLEMVESEVYQTEGTKQEIAKKAKRCIGSEVSNEAVIISDSRKSLGLFGGKIGGGDSDVESSNIQGGGIFISTDIEEGTIIAKNRVDYRAKFLEYNAKSTLKFLAKDGRFKIKHTNIQNLQKKTGYMANSGYSNVFVQWGSGWQAVEKALNGVSTKIAKCVQKVEKEEDW